jgi:DNA invertase Pin-like site-specific DNA recombinase
MNIGYGRVSSEDTEIARRLGISRMSVYRVLQSIA